MEDFSKYLIKDHTYWSVSVHRNQGYLGRCVVWCKRENALDLAEATKEEQEELFLILQELQRALKKTFQANWFNYAFLGNETRHLHGHVIPRYSSERECGGVTFKDEHWGHNYHTDHDFITSEIVLRGIRDVPQKAFDV